MDNLYLKNSIEALIHKSGIWRVYKVIRDSSIEEKYNRGKYGDTFCYCLLGTDD